MTKAIKDAFYISRCFQLALKGGKQVRPNPLVGSVLVYQDRIIGEGWHQSFGGPHAEVNCLNSVRKADLENVQNSTLYISLEPCSFHGKTPACTNLILQNKIPRVVISVLDPNPKVNGSGLKLLKQNGVEVKSGILEEQGKQMINTFHVNQLLERPYVILKIVKSKYNYIGKHGQKIWLSNQYTTLLSHKWRSEVDGIMVGTETVLNDDPSLDNRMYPGTSPVRIFPDRQGRVTDQFKVLDGTRKTIVINERSRNIEIPEITQLSMDFSDENLLKEILSRLYEQGIYVLLIEGGATLIKSFLDKELWDEARVIHTNHELNEGITAPNVMGKLIDRKKLDTDIYQRIMNNRLAF